MKDKSERNSEIVKMIDAGRSYAAVGREFSLCRDRVRRIYQNETKIRKVMKKNEVYKIVLEKSQNRKCANALHRKKIRTIDDVKRILPLLVEGRLKITGIGPEGIRILQEIVEEYENN